jgi:hypothetical protein
MFRFTLRDGLWLVVLLLSGGGWWLDRSLLATNLKNCRFVLEQQRETIRELSQAAVQP